MQWVTLDIKVILSDLVFRDIIDADPAHFTRFLTLVCLAKEAADLDDHWQGHLVRPDGRPLTVVDFVRAGAETGRRLCQKWHETITLLSQYSIIARESESEPWVIVDWLRWFQKSEKSSTARTRAWRERQRERRSVTSRERVGTPLPYPTQPDHVPPNPQGGTEGDPYGSEDPEFRTPEEKAQLELPASNDPSKLASLLTRKQFEDMRGYCMRRLITLSTAGLSKGVLAKLDRFLSCLPPPHWREGPLRWAHHLAHWVSEAVSDTQERMDNTAKEHHPGSPADWAMGNAGRACAEELARSRKHYAEAAKSG